MQYFYTDVNGQQQGPINSQQLQELAVQGTIIPNTPLETDTGHKGIAGQIQGLQFKPQVPEEKQDLAIALMGMCQSYFYDQGKINTKKAVLVACGISFFIAFLGLLAGNASITLVFCIIAFIPALALVRKEWKERDIKAEQELKDRANQGDVQAQYDLACRYQQRRKQSEATQLFEQAAQNGHTLAQYHWGKINKEGNNVERNPAQAVYWFEKAAEQGCADAQYELGHCYQAGIGIAPNTIQATVWFEKAAKQGHADAQCTMERKKYQLPKQLFCTNCGNSISEKTVACMSCGAKPDGHKKFCCQCGVGLNPEQIVCIKCGSSIADISPSNDFSISGVLASGNGKENPAITHWWTMGIIGAVASVVFLVFAANSLKNRIDDLGWFEKEKKRQAELFLAIVKVSTIVAPILWLIGGAMYHNSISDTNIQVKENEIAGKGVGKYFIWGDLRRFAFRLGYNQITSVDVTDATIIIHAAGAQYKCYVKNPAEIQKVIFEQQQQSKS